MANTSSHHAVITSIMPSPHPVVAKAADPVVALRIMLDILAALELYKEYLAEHILENPFSSIGNKRKLACHFERLCDLEALVVLVLIWKESRRVTEAELKCAGFDRETEDGATRYFLGNALLTSSRRAPSYRLSAKYARRASRIVEAAMTYGLVEEACGCSKRKPLQATTTLHQLMTEVGSDAAVLIHALFQGHVCELSHPGNGAGGVGK